MKKLLLQLFAASTLCALLAVQGISTSSLGYCKEAAAALPAQFAATDVFGLRAAVPDGVSWVYAPGKLDQVISADLDCDGEEELVGVTESNEIYYSDDFLTWNSLPGRLGQITAGYFDDDCYEDLAGVTDSGDIYYTVDLTTWYQIPGKLGQVSGGDFDNDGRDELVGVTKSGQIYYLLDHLAP